MAQIATITVETAGGPVDLPVYEPGDSGSGRLEAFRVQTASGPGFVPLAAVDEADRPYLRVQTSSGVRAVDTSASGIPDSVVWQVAAGTFSTGDSTWEDQIGSNDASITGDPQSETLGSGDGVRGDGTDDYAFADVPNVESDPTFGVAMTFSSTDSSVFPFARSETGVNEFLLDFGGRTESGSGEVGLRLQDSNDNHAEAHADVTVNDGSVHYLIINKNSDTPSDWDFYIDQTGSPVSKTVTTDANYNSADHTPSRDMGVFARNNSGIAKDYANISIGVLEFNSEPYTQSDRESFVSRRPEI